MGRADDGVVCVMGDEGISDEKMWRDRYCGSLILNDTSSKEAGGRPKRNEDLTVDNETHTPSTKASNLEQAAIANK